MAAMAIALGLGSICIGYSESSAIDIVIAGIGCSLFAVTTWLGNKFFPGLTTPVWAVIAFSGLFGISASFVQRSQFSFVLFGLFVTAAGIAMVLRIILPHANVFGMNQKNYVYGSNFLLDAISSPPKENSKNKQASK